jgi:hypothetical protein
MKVKATYDPAFFTWLPDVKACHEKKILKTFSTRNNISQDGGLPTEINQKI